ncbi:hypothetical protein D3C72_1453640 [compost metagenome]
MNPRCTDAVRHPRSSFHESQLQAAPSPRTAAWLQPGGQGLLGHGAAGGADGCGHRCGLHRAVSVAGVGATGGRQRGQHWHVPGRVPPHPEAPQRRRAGVDLAGGGGALGAGFAAHWLGQRVSLLPADVHSCHRDCQHARVCRAHGAGAAGVLPGPACTEQPPGPARPPARPQRQHRELGAHLPGVRHVGRAVGLLPPHDPDRGGSPAQAGHARPADRPGQPQPLRSPVHQRAGAQPARRCASHPAAV